MRCVSVSLVARPLLVTTTIRKLYAVSTSSPIAACCVAVALSVATVLHVFPDCCSTSTALTVTPAACAGSVHARLIRVCVAFDALSPVAGFGAASVVVDTASESAFPLLVASRMRKLYAVAALRPVTVCDAAAAASVATVSHVVPDWRWTSTALTVTSEACAGSVHARSSVVCVAFDAASPLAGSGVDAGGGVCTEPVQEMLTASLAEQLCSPHPLCSQRPSPDSVPAQSTLSSQKLMVLGSGRFSRRLASPSV